MPKLLCLACTSLIAAACAAQDETVITTTTTTTTSSEDLSLHRTATVEQTSPVKLDVLSGLRFGGIIGGSLVSSLRYDTHHHVSPEVQALVGVSGTKFTLGPRLSLREEHWTLNAEGLTLQGDTDTAIVPRGIICYRWEDEDRSPSLWRGIVGHDGWYYGAEVSVIVRDMAFDIDVTWRQNDPRKPQYTLAYGFDF